MKSNVVCFSGPVYFIDLKRNSIFLHAILKHFVTIMNKFSRSDSATENEDSQDSLADETESPATR